MREREREKDKEREAACKTNQVVTNGNAGHANANANSKDVVQNGAIKSNPDDQPETNANPTQCSISCPGRRGE